MATIIPLDQVEPALVEALLDRAFEPERQKRTAYKVRDGVEWLPGLSFAALDDEDYLVGTIQCWPVALTDEAGRAHPLVMVGPVAVLPEQQNDGYGKALTLASLSALEDLAGDAAPLPQVLIGDADYYGRFFGFTAQGTAGWQLPGPWDPARLLVRTDNQAVLPETGMLGPWRG
ncbi:GNAT family N-acetyltransferase [Croceicoccus naphthovorans]|uniref:GCN5 family acetyltransferase n=1 Tax=Croceicoccus naphthovorans TaxID=1348774 RepID=A0A0G3XHV4_9SPHN|nr:N-acetyltransferase [Croceicoccus naphthovorans]AKM10184.1 GCN5 family acetyltransferase [Croceicoccus naphthovorans]MBB3990578.1 putative N-acetyltransferase YhbS [Croceicoccus naphthovorans]